jgi:hypothetical protein
VHLVNTNTYLNTHGTTEPIRAVDHPQPQPTFRGEFCRMPKPGTLCPWTGLSRTKMWNVLQTGKVKTVCLRRPGAAKGARLVHLASLLEYLHSQAETLGN